MPPSRTSHGRRGTALIEFVFSIPLLALVIAATFFFGMVMKHQLRLRQADRYVAWRQAHNSEAGADGNNYAYIHYGEPDQGDDRAGFLASYNEANHVAITSDLINELFLSNEAEDIAIGQGSGPIETLEELVDATDDHSPQAGDLADRAVLGDNGNGAWPHGQTARTGATFPNEVRAMERIERAMQVQAASRPGSGGSHRASRDGAFWRRWQNSYIEPLRELYLDNLDDATDNIDDTQLRSNIRNLYSERW